MAANLSAPDARAPNVVLLAVPAATEGDWTPEALFSVVDEAIELARCRMVDLDATKRVPQLLPACFINDYDEPQSWSSLLTGMVGTAVRYRAEVTP